MINVVNKRTFKGEHGVYIGRGSVLGNPYTHKQSTKDEYVVGSVQEAVDCYEGYLFGKVVTKDKDMEGLLESLKVSNINEFQIKLADYKIFNITATKDYILEKLASEEAFDKTKVNIFFEFEEDISYFTVKYEGVKITEGNCKFTDGEPDVEFTEPVL